MGTVHLIEIRKIIDFCFLLREDTNLCEFKDTRRYEKVSVEFIVDLNGKYGWNIIENMKSDLLQDMIE